MGALAESRQAREAEACRLRADGLKLREIAERMGVAISTVDAYLNDPGGARLRARKDGYRGRCDECGGPTDGSNGPGKAPHVCQECLTWTEDEIVAAIRSWAAAHGGLPPTTADWRHAQPNVHPNCTTVMRELGWNEALLRAGFALRCDRRPETFEWIKEQLRAGRSTDEIGDALGVTCAAIIRRFRYRGESIQDYRRNGHG